MGQISDSPCNVRNKIFQHPSYIYGSMLEFTDSLTCLGFGKQKQTKHQSEFGGTTGGERRPYTGFPCGSADKESTRNVGDLGSIPGFGRSPGEGKGYPLQYSGLKNSMDYIVPGFAKSRTQLSNFPFHEEWGLIEERTWASSRQGCCSHGGMEIPCMQIF